MRPAEEAMEVQNVKAEQIAKSNGKAPSCRMRTSCGWRQTSERTTSIDMATIQNSPTSSVNEWIDLITGLSVGSAPLITRGATYFS